jgi:predicted Rossmann fold nucleotide-binding protein DprA/Smf involved in DNA uptake
MIFERGFGSEILQGLGNAALLEQRLIAFFASRQCTGAAISAAMDWAVQQAKAKQTVISGFHSPLEQSVLAVLLQAKSPVVVVLSRSVERARLPSSWHQPLSLGLMAVVSCTQSTKRLTAQQATKRNNIVAQLAQQIVIGYASPDGELAHSCEKWEAAGGYSRTIFHYLAG